MEKTALAAEKTDIAVILITDTDISQELLWYRHFKKKKTPVVVVISKADAINNLDEIKALAAREKLPVPLIVSAAENIGIQEFKETLIRLVPDDYEMQSIVGSMAGSGDTVLLVMPVLGRKPAEEPRAMMPYGLTAGS